MVFDQDQCRRKGCRELPHRARGVQGYTLVKHVLVFRFHVRIRECNQVVVVQKKNQTKTH